MKSISISINPEKNTQNTVTEETTQVKTERKKAFSEDDLHQSWKLMCESMEKEVHILKSIQKSTLKLKDEHHIDLRVENGIQEKIILDLKSEILSFLRDSLENDSIDFSISVEMSDINKPTTNQDRFNEMLAENEDFRRLADELSLEI